MGRYTGGVAGWLLPHYYLAVDDADAVDSLIADGATVVDTRSPEDYAAGHVPGAINVGVSEILADPEAFFARGDVPADKPVLLHGAGGPSADLHAAAAALEARPGTPRIYLTSLPLP